MELYISIGAAAIALYAVLVQKKALTAQQRELQKSAEANDKAQRALQMQTELQALSSLLDTEIHLHNFNNQKGVDPDKQKKWAAKNFEVIGHLKKRIEKKLDGNRY